MSADSQASASSRPVPSLSAVPRALWIAFGAVSVAAAGLGGALVAKSSDPVPAVAAASTGETPSRLASMEPASMPATAASLQPAAAAQPAPVVQPAPQVQAVPAPARIARPAPAPVAPARPVDAPQPVAVARTPVQAEPAQPVQTTRAPLCASCGTVESVQAVQQPAQGSGIGAVAGGVLGGVLGNQVGGGDGRKAMTVLGAIGGGFAGNEVEKRVRATTVHDVQVRMEDGSLRSFRQAQPLAVGTRVVAEGSTLRVAGEGTGRGAGDAGVRVLRTSGPAGI